MAVGTIGLLLEASIMMVLLWMIIFIFRMYLDSRNEKNGKKSANKDSDSIGTTLENGDSVATTKGEPSNLLMMIAILIFVMVIVHIKVGFELKGTSEDYPALIMAGIPLGIVGLILFWNIIMYGLGKEKKRRYGLKSERNELTKEDLKKIDMMRKMHHLIGFFLIFGALLIADRYLKAHQDNPEYVRALENFWGSVDGTGFVDKIFVREYNTPLAKSLIMLWMYGEALVLLTFEVTRLSKHIFFPFHKMVQGTMRYKEIDTFAALSHYGLGYLFAAICLPPVMFIAAFCLITFADPMASTIGIRYGAKIFKKRFSFNGKSVEGLIAGMGTAFFTMFWIVGWQYALAGAIVFGVIDIITPKPIEMSDNMLMPVVVTIVFIIMAAAGVPATNYFGFA